MTITEEMLDMYADGKTRTQPQIIETEARRLEDSIGGVVEVRGVRHGYQIRCIYSDQANEDTIGAALQNTFHEMITEAVDND